MTEEFHPGFRNSTASYTVSLLQPKVIADMGLHDHGYARGRAADREFPAAWRMAYLQAGRRAWRGRRREFARFSATDAAAPARTTTRLWSELADVLRDLALKAPPNAGGGLAALATRGAAGLAAGALDLAAQRDLLALFTQSAREFLEPLVRGRPGQGSASASTRSSAITPVPTRPARPMCCCTMCSAK